MTAKNFTPALGYAVVELVEPGKSRGGIELVGSSQAEFARFYLVKSSAGHFQEGKFVEATATPGQRLWIAPSTRMVPNPHKRGEFYEQDYLRLKNLGDALPETHRLVMLSDVIGWADDDTKN